MNKPPRHYHLCPLCGFEFERTETRCADGCPMGRFCNLIRCPNCQYEFPAEPRLLGWVRRLFCREPSRATQRAMVGLHELEVGEQGELACLSCEQHGRRNALAVYGLVPGSRLLLQQKRPAFVVRVGETELALEDDIAREILVKRLPLEQPA
jgi:Fe2+ transport system protein FeoA